MNQTTGKNRNTIDKYYTKTDISQVCIDNFIKYISPTKDSLIIEPSAGNGSFYKILREEYNIIGYDIEPEHTDIIKQDFLKLELSDKKVDYIGNPPFGRQSSIAKKFIKRCCEDANSISFILPKSFKKQSMNKSFSLNFHLIFEEDLSENSFVINGDVERDVPCVFQIWKRMDNKRELEKKIMPVNFKYVKKTETPDFSIRRVGVYAGKISIDIDNKSPQSHYYIKLNDDIDDTQFIETYNTIIFEHNNTVGPKSICKNELNRKINELKLINKIKIKP